MAYLNLLLQHSFSFFFSLCKSISLPPSFETYLSQRDLFSQKSFFAFTIKIRTKRSATKPQASKDIARRRELASRAAKRKEKGDGSSNQKGVPEDILEPKCWDLNFMKIVEPVFVKMVQLQKWRNWVDPPWPAERLELFSNPGSGGVDPPWR